MIKIGKILKQRFYERSPEIVAEELLGKVLVRKLGNNTLAGIIVETESYGGDDDPASHAYKKKTERNRIMFGPPGYAYVYFCYGMYFLFNIVTEKVNIPSAVLIRALEPIKGIEIMKNLRKNKEIRKLTDGPGKLTQALKIDKNFNGKPIFKGELVIRDSDYTNFKIKRDKRIGIKVGKDELLRFYISNNPYISVK